MQQESSQSDQAERDVPSRSRARFPGGAAEGAGAEQICLSVRVSVCRRRSLSSVWDTHTKKSFFRLPRSGLGISGYGCIAVLLLFSPLRDVTPLDAPVPIEEEGEEGGILVILRLPGEIISLI